MEDVHPFPPIGGNVAPATMGDIKSEVCYLFSERLATSLQAASGMRVFRQKDGKHGGCASFPPPGEMSRSDKGGHKKSRRSLLN